jgi:YcxB-like protein
MTPIEISVSYGLCEYLSIVQDHLPSVLARTGTAPARNTPGVFSRAMVAAAASISFFLKKWRMPVCDFLIDEEHIRRKTRLGELVVPWSELICIHRYSRGYLLEKANGSIPLPYRCFSAEQASAFDLLVEDFEDRKRVERHGI